MLLQKMNVIMLSAFNHLEIIFRELFSFVQIRYPNIDTGENTAKIVFSWYQVRLNDIR